MGHDRILIATDGSDAANAAAAEAAAFAKAFDATLHALYVLKAAEPPPNFNDPEAKEGVDTQAGQALTDVASAAADVGLSTDVITAAVPGETGPSILRYADEHDIDLLVMGKHSRTGIDRLITGSVAEHVVRKAPIPVVTVPRD